MEKKKESLLTRLMGMFVRADEEQQIPDGSLQGNTESMAIEEKAVQEEVQPESKVVSIGILGSCVTRDVFNFDEQQQFTINYYQARTSLVSLMSPSLKVKETDIALTSAFQKRMVLGDCNKTFFKQIALRKPEYLIIDFIDERFDVIQSGNAFVTRSREFINSKLSQNIRKHARFSVEEREELWNDAVQRFADKIITLYEPSQLVLHEAYYKDKYVTKDREVRSFDADILSDNEKNNRILQGFYQQLQQLIPGIVVIKPSEKYLASESHMWGLSPFHYEDAYYREFITTFEKLCQ
ncbi:DUF6270 domain-containing protein [Ectobacillus antri]|uniref:DUF6270 domain-containing protein n=1 Tax=Ectobacillus antri TaxID=2486280 RepID=A0ABT6H6D8_9BACI|nr:DUF6270 domain-containing protein [Ectobacillus antri]MDG4658134.1 DUF6270 domain-containing protein [Ectobacillus antri]MDG5754920.1 DUF6270 domain-containing protein [Ectobacillus antri]